MPTNSSDNPNHSTFLTPTPLETSVPLEASAPLDFRDETASTLPPKKPGAVPFSRTSQPQPQAGEPPIERDRVHQSDLSAETPPVGDQHRQGSLSPRQTKLYTPPNVIEEHVIQLLEERLVVDRKRRKIGEVIVRKEIETHIIEVPVRREKLIVEQVGSEKPLATIDLGQPVVNGDEAEQPSLQPTINGAFASIKAAIQFLETVASTHPTLADQTVRVNIQVENVG